MRPADSRSVAWFLGVGGLATAVHYTLALCVNEFASLSAPIANATGFLCAFPVSYLGHRRFSFAGTAAAHRTALPRLFAVACAGFAANQGLLLMLLRLTPLPLWIALGIVLLAVAAATYLLGRWWAFAAP